MWHGSCNTHAVDDVYSFFCGIRLQKHYDHYDAFVVLHGTDTMAYTASALSFMLENLGKSVVVTGSQVRDAQLMLELCQQFVGATSDC